MKKKYRKSVGIATNSNQALNAGDNSNAANILIAKQPERLANNIRKKIFQMGVKQTKQKQIASVDSVRTLV